MALFSTGRRSYGTVSHSTESYGFISVKDKRLSVSMVYFDHKSFVPRERGNLSLKYGEGTLVSFNIIPSNGEQKKKHRAANVIKENCCCSANARDPPRSTTEKSGMGKACKRFLTNHLMENGAEVIEVLINDLSDDDDCPAVLRNATMDKIIKFASENENIFVVKNSSLCLVEMEERVAEVFETAMEKYDGRMVMSQVNGVFSSQGDTRIYLYAGNWQNGVKDYIARNPSDLIYWDDQIFTKEYILGNRELYGSLLSCFNIPTNGEHKKKHQAAHVIEENCSCSANSSDPPRSATEKSGMGKACKRFLTNHLMENGAEVIEVLINDLSDDDDCPAVLRNATTDKIIKFASENENIFVVKNSSLCLVEMEKRVAEVFETAMEKYGGRMTMSRVNGVFSSQGDTRIYLYAGNWQNGVKDYIARNPSDLIHWDDQIWTKEFMLENEHEYETFQNNLKAVKYFSQFVLGKVVTVASLCGHIAQASPAIKSYVSASRSDFPDFLSKNSFFFAVDDDEVECSTHRMAVLDRYWLKDERNRNRAKAKNVKSVCKSPPPSPMKAFCETGFVSSPKTAVACSDQNDIYTFMDKKRDNAASETLPDSFLRLTTSTPSIFSTSEEKAFSELLGKETASSLEKEMQSRNLSSLNDLILLRFHLGKQPRVKLFDSSCSSVINCTLTNSGTIDGSVIQNILGKKGLLKQITGVRYAVKNTLHSVRVSEENGKTTGLTVFCQIHGKCSNEIDVIQRKKFTAVVSNISKFPAKYVYNILRNRCCELSRDNDVLLLDVDGQLSGLDDKPHSSVGTEVHRVLCSSSELPEKIRDAIQLFHDYVILINVDDRDILQLVFKMCSRGINVIAEVPSELRNEIDRIFTS